MSAGVHHDDAVAGAEKEFRLADYADAVVGDAVKQQNPDPVGIFRADFPAAEKSAIWRMHHSE